ncbi:lysine--tRNA ligase, partial [Patescibacteria group bacterium]|nr:lysine--tRNA ligase [Patescibacteria group bacterium]
MAQQRLEEIRKIRLEKVERLREMGIDPYPAKVDGSPKEISSALKSLNKTVEVAGRIMGWREHGNVIFADLKDESGQIQLWFQKNSLKESYKTLKLFDIGDFIYAKGKVVKTSAGEISIDVTKFQILTKSIRPLPSKWHGLKDIEERFRKKYLDLIMNPEAKRRLDVRSGVITAIREFLDKKGYVEVETPTLQPVYGGGFAKPFVTHHNALDSDFYLRISDEMYLKRLIVGGFEKVYEITKVFRNEGVDHDHNPEFTMFEAQIAFEDYRHGMDIIEEIIEYAAKKVLGTTKVKYQKHDIDVKRPWKRYQLVEAVKEFTGIDPLEWKTLDEAKDVTKKMEMASEKLKGLDKIETVGEVIAFAFEETVEEKLVQPTIIYDYPIEVSPLAKKCNDPRFTQRFEMFAFGSELGNNYSELNDPIDLSRRFVEEKRREKAGFDEAHQTDDDYLTAIEHGFPPTCGIAIGIDRLIMLLTNSKSIREVIAFPTLKPVTVKKKAEKNITQKGEDRFKVDLGIDYQGAKKLLAEHIKDEITKLHCIESEAIMRGLAKHFGEDEETWGIIGLLHDIDWETTKDDTSKHCILSAEILKKAGATDFLIETIQSHGFGSGWREDVYYGPEEFKEKERSGKIQHALVAAETLTG